MPDLTSFCKALANYGYGYSARIEGMALCDLVHVGAVEAGANGPERLSLEAGMVREKINGKKINTIPRKNSAGQVVTNMK